MAFGFAIARFGLFLREVAQVGQIRVVHGTGSSWIGVVLVALGLVTNASATVRYSRMRKAILERQSVAPDPALVYVLGVGSVLIAAAMAALLARTLGG